MNPSEQAVAVENDLPAGIRIFDPIRPIPGIVEVGVEPCAAFEQIVVAGAAG